MQLGFFTNSHDRTDELALPSDVNFFTDYFPQITIITPGFFVTAVITTITQVPAPSALAAFAGLGLIAPRRRR